MTAAFAAPFLPFRIATQDRGTTLRLAGPVAGLATLDPALTRDLPSLFVVRQVFRGLLRFDADLLPVPDLAERVEASEDLRTFTFHLHPRARFADGTPIDSNAVIRSLTHALDPATAGGNAALLATRPYLGDIAGAADLLGGAATDLAGLLAPDSQTVTITLEAPSATFLRRIAAVQAAIVNPASVAMVQPNASGPFTVETLEDAILSLVPNPSYAGRQPSIDRMEIAIGPTASQPENLLQAGTIDLAQVSGTVAAQLTDPASGLDISVVDNPLFATTYIAMSNTMPPFDDAHLRRALQLVLDPHRIANVMFDGTVRVATGLVPEGMLGTTWQSPLVRPALDRARQELSLSSYDGESIPVYAADIGPVEALRDVAAETLGIVIEAVQVPWATFLTDLAAGRYPAYCLYWGADYPDPEAFLRMLFHSSGSDNYIAYRNADFDALLDEACQVGDDALRSAIYAQAQELLLDDAAVIPLYHDVGYTAFRNGIAGLETTPLGILGMESVTVRS